MTHSSRNFKHQVSDNLVTEFGLESQLNTPVSSPYKKITNTAVMDKLVDAYRVLFCLQQEDKYAYNSMISCARVDVEAAIKLLAQVIEDQHQALAALAATQAGNPIPHHAVDRLKRLRGDIYRKRQAAGEC